jgi:hypothetical protein
LPFTKNKFTSKLVYNGLQVRPVGQAGYPISLVASWDTVPVKCCEMGYPAWPTGRTCNPLCTNFDVNLFFVNGNRLSQEPDRRSFAHAAIWFTYYLMLELLMPASNLVFIFWFWTCWCLIPTWLIFPLWNHLNTFLVVINYRYLFVDITMYIAEGSLGSLLQFGCHLKGFSSQQITPMIQFFIYCVKPVCSYGYYYILFQ